jgi:8-oxo-dGTP diphosphatase
MPPLHILAVAGLVRKDDKVLILYSEEKGDWEFPGGQAEEGETVTQALQREILEETGVTAEVKTLTGIYSNIKNHPPILMLDFLCDWVSGDLLTSSESQKVEWVAREEAASRIWRGSIRQRMIDMINFNGQVTYRAYGIDRTVTPAQYNVFEEKRI